MPIETYNNVRGFTFIQSIEPLTPEHLDSWFNTSNDIVKIYDSGKWVNFASFHPYPGTQYGYAMGGYNGPNQISIIDRITFPFDSGIASHVGNLSGSRTNNSGYNSSNYGYCIAGLNGANYLSAIDRIEFPFDSGTASYVGNLSAGRKEAASCDQTDFVSLFV